MLTSKGLSDAYIAATAQSLEVPPPAEGVEMAVPDVEQEERMRPLWPRYRSEGIRSILALPLRGTAGEYGSLTFYFRAAHDFAESELSLARAIANLSAAAITAAQLAESHRAAEEELRQRVADQQRAETGLSLLAHAGVILNESLDYNTTLTNLTRSVVPGLGDWCSVHVVEEGEVKLVATSHANPAKMAWAAELRQRYPERRDPDAPRALYRVIRTGQSEMMARIPEELLAQAMANLDEERARIISELQLNAYICVPLRTRTEVIGALTLIYAESGRTYDQRDLELAEEFGRRAGLAVEKARLFTRSETARAELERSNQAKDEFLGIVSHELRTPVTTIYGSARLINVRGAQLDEATRATLLEGIESESAKMVRLIENLLLLARLELGQSVEKSTVEIVPLLEHIANPAKLARRVNLHLDSSVTCVAGQPTYLEQVLTNLLENADKYSPPDEVIDLVVEKQGDLAVFRVQDRGPGVAPEELSLIFDSFYRSERTEDFAITRQRTRPGDLQAPG
jgi:K+-sensing histidine kinase KdpD